MEALAEELVKQLVIGKSVAFFQLADAEIRGDQIPVQAGQPIVVQILQVSSAHVFLKKPAEILRLERRYLSSLFQSDGRPVILVRIGEHRVEAGKDTGTFWMIINRHFLKKLPVKQIKKFKQIPLKAQQITGTAILLQPHHIKKQIPQSLDILLYLRVWTVIVNYKPEMGDVGQKRQKKIIGDLHQDRPVPGGTPGRMHQTGIDQKHLTGLQGNGKIKERHNRGSLQHINNLNRLMPVTRRKTAVIDRYIKTDLLIIRDGDRFFPRFL